MKFNKLTIENFLAVGEASIKLNDVGLLLIQGENRDDSSQNSNGAGKSSIVDALCWGLYGFTARGESGDNVINATAKKNTRVTIDIDDDGQLYKVVRHRKFTKKRNVLELWKIERKDDKLPIATHDLTGGTDKITQAAIEKVIGCSYSVFRASIYAAQEDQVDLPALTDKMLKSIVEESAGIDRLQQVHEIAKSKLRDSKSLLEIANSKFSNTLNAVHQIKDDIKESKQEQAHYEELKVIQIKTHEDDMKSIREELMARIPIIKKFDKVKTDAKILVITNRNSNDWHQRHREILNTLMTSKSRATVKSQSLSVAKSAAKASKDRIINIDNHVGEDCQECGKLYLEEDMEEAKSVAENSLRVYLAKFKEAKLALEEAQKIAEKDEVTLADYEATRPDDSKDKAELVALNNYVRKHEALHEEMNQLKIKLGESSDKIGKLNKSENPHDKSLKRATDKAIELIKEAKDIKSKIEQLEVEVQVDEGVAQVYSNAGVRAHILDTVTPFLNQRTSNYLGQLSDGNLQATWNTLGEKATGELRENFHINVTSLTGGKTYKQLSGGEKRKVKLATNMALQDLVSNRASKPISLYIGDEIDHALDVSSLERLMAVLEERAKAHGTVLVISHNELSDWIRESVTVVKQNGFASIQ